jgi:hypothetical protein
MPELDLAALTALREHQEGQKKGAMFSLALTLFNTQMEKDIRDSNIHLSMQDSILLGIQFVNQFEQTIIALEEQNEKKT